MREYTLRITDDEALVLFEWLNRFDDTGRLDFMHAAEYCALMGLHGQIDATTPAIFQFDYARVLREARDELAEGFEGNVPGLII